MNKIICSYKLYLKNLFVFTGRTSRSDFWRVILVNFIILLITGFIPVLGNVAIIWTFVSQLGLTVRRLHDIGKQDICCALLFIPIIGWILIFIWLTKTGEQSENKYGPDPLEAENGETENNAVFNNSESNQPLTCGVCGAKVAETDEYCPECGSKLGGDYYG